MSFLGPYRKSFQLALSTQLAYRVNFIVGRLREFLVYAAMLFLYSALPHGAGSYSQAELLTYTVVSSVLGAVAFIYSMESIANEIADGDLTNYLLRPLNYFGAWVSRNLAMRCLVLVGGFVQLGVLYWLFSGEHFVFQTQLVPILETAVLFVGSIVLVQAFDFLGGLFSFWTNRGHGMRWLIMIFVQFLSGSYLPLDALPGPIHTILSYTPFPSILFAPLEAYLGRLSPSAWLQTFLVQWLWIGVIILIVRSVWQRGLKTYGAYGR